MKTSRFAISLGLAFTLALTLMPLGARHTGVVWAHSPVETSSPADGETLAAAPETLVLNFENPARVLRVEVTHTGDGAAAGEASDLDIPSRDLTDSITLTPPSLGAGSYLVEWRALGEDGHAMDGSFTYTVSAQ